MALPSILITGASGFVGDRLVQQLAELESGHLYCLSRSPSPRMRTLAEQKRATCLEVDLATGTLPDELPAVDTVIHLAAATGKAQRATHFATNERGTTALLQRCARWGVRHFVFVSTIATQFKETTHYHYAQSKQAAERAVAASGLPFTIVRPTIVAGRGSGAWEGLRKLARAPVIPIFGNGRARLQPIHVDDLVAALLCVAQERKVANECLDLGGPEVIDVEGLLRRMRQTMGKGTGPAIHLPLRLIQRMLGLVEGLLLPVLPLTAGQLSVFGEDGTAAANPLWNQLMPRMKRIDEMIAEDRPNG